MYNDEVDFQCEVLLTLKRFWGPLPPPLEFLMKFEEVFHPRPASNDATQQLRNVFKQQRGICGRGEDENDELSTGFR